MFEPKGRKPPTKLQIQQKALKDNAKALKKIGVLDIDLRKPLSSSEKNKVRRLSKQYDPVIKNPGDFFHLKADSIRQTRKARSDPSMIAHGKNIFVPKEGYKTAKLIDDRIVIQRPDGYIKDKKGNFRKVDKKLTIYMSDKKDILSLLESMQNKPLAANQSLMVRIGNNAAFPHQGVRTRMDYKALLNYVSNWEPDALREYRNGTYQGKKSYGELLELKTGLISQMAIVSRPYS